MAFGEIIIFTATSLGRTKILQFFYRDPPKVAQPKLTFVLGRMGTSAQNDGGSAHPSTHGYMILAHIKSQNRNADTNKPLQNANSSKPSTKL